MSEIKPRIAVMEFAQAMERKLRENSHKRHWRYADQQYLFDRLKDEYGELCATWPSDHDALMDECVDLANFTMMLFDNASREKESPHD